MTDLHGLLDKNYKPRIESHKVREHLTEVNLLLNISFNLLNTINIKNTYIPISSIVIFNPKNITSTPYRKPHKNMNG